MFELIQTLGLPYDQMYLLGKIYSTNEEVYRELKRRGAYVHPDSINFDAAQLVIDYKLNLAEVANELLDKAIAHLKRIRAPKTLLVVDDGGVLLSTVNSRIHEIDAHVVGVEQTRSGAEMLRTIPDFAFPIVNVAESKTKLQDESPCIAASIVEHVSKRLARLPDHKPLAESKVLIVGHGAIGKNVAAQLHSKVRKVEAHDIIDLPGVAIIREFKEAVHDKDVVIGCVGKAWLPSDHQALLPNGVVLASGSSSNSEFLGLTIDPDRHVASALSFRASSLVRAHADYSFNGGKGWVLGAGFPVNFDGSIDPIPPDAIELTRMLMLGGIMQALTSETEPGLRQLAMQEKHYSKDSGTHK